MAIIIASNNGLARNARPVIGNDASNNGINAQCTAQINEAIKPAVSKRVDCLYEVVVSCIFRLLKQKYKLFATMLQIDRKIFIIL